MEKYIYTNLFHEYSKYNAWKSDESFPIDKIDRKRLDDFKIVEYIFDGVQSQREQKKFENLRNKFKSELLNILFFDKCKKYLFAIEHSSSLFSRIRSHKGLVDKTKIQNSLFLQKEYILNDAVSRIAFVAVINFDTFSYLSDFFFDSTCSFIISTKNDYLNEEFLDEVTERMQLLGWTHINFLNQMLFFCSKGDDLYRIGGDDGEQYWSIQRFTAR